MVCFLLSVVVFLVGQAAFALEPGDMAVVIQDTQAMVGERISHDIERGAIITVELTDKQWLWVGHDSAGWIPTSKVVPLVAGMSHINEALRKKPSSVGYCNRALCWISQRQLDRAAADLNEAKGLAPHSAEVYRASGMLEFAHRKFDQAAEDYSGAIAHNPQNSIWRFERGIVLQNRGDRAGAIAEFTAALKLNPTLVPALLHRSETLRELGNFAPAIADCDQCLKLQPDLVKAYLCRANVLRDQGRMDKAIADYDHALQLAPGSAIALVERGLARQAVGKYQQAINDYGRALAIDKGFLLAYNGLAWILATCPDAPLRDGKKAVEFATKACERGGWVHSDELDTLAAAYAERGQFDEAIKWQQKAIELASTDADKAEFQQRLSLYSRHEAFRDTPRQP